eukprot:scaffold88478_cov64-Phaeocystis_antarctica.AAC.1
MAAAAARGWPACLETVLSSLRCAPRLARTLLSRVLPQPPEPVDIHSLQPGVIAAAVGCHLSSAWLRALSMAHLSARPVPSTLLLLRPYYYRPAYGACAYARGSRPPPLPIASTHTATACGWGSRPPPLPIAPAHTFTITTTTTNTIDITTTNSTAALYRPAYRPAVYGRSP